MNDGSRWDDINRGLLPRGGTSYDAVAFAEGSQPPGARPLYRFWKPSDGTHFYTMSDPEADQIPRDYSHVFDNVAYYAYE